MFDCELVGKIGSMALIRHDEYDIDYNVFSRVGAELITGFIWISSGAVEIGRIDYMRKLIIPPRKKSMHVMQLRDKEF